MSIIYFTEQGGYLRKKRESIKFEKDGEVILEKPIRDISLIVLFGRIQVSVQAMLALLDNGCDISMMTQDGHFRGKVVSALGKNAELRSNQFRLAEDEDFCFKISKSIVSAKILNGINLIQKYSYSGRHTAKASNIENLKSILNKIEKCDNIDTLRGFEGTAARYYFEDLGKFFIGDVKFEGRKYFPSTDPVNALLSFGYSFIGRELQGILEALGLDPYIGYFHKIKYGRASLSLDITEEFRHAVVDRLVLKIFNKNILNLEDFYYNERTGGCYLKRNALKIFIKFYEEYMLSENRTYGKKEDVSQRKIFWSQAEKLKNAIQNNEDYEPFKMN